MAVDDLHVINHAPTHDDHEEHEHDHKQSFWTHYIFSTDHKMIAKQYLISGMLWAIIGGFFSIVFRLQLGFQNMDLEWLRPIFGHWSRGKAGLRMEWQDAR